ncbi:MAG: DNA polymerase III subunit epsilon [Acetobacteraceae bacterium]|nr:DNA polymerase III subunit epsilon [Acetobacteraceae bacterium]
MRRVLLDTETTGIDPAQGHRILEICCIELVNHLPTGRHFHRIIDPERESDPEAERIHGFSRRLLQGRPKFADIAAELLAFLGQQEPLVAHNAPFDAGHINAELARLDLAPVASSRWIDTVRLARQKFPGAPASLDALCRRFGIDLSERTTHNALLDCKLLAEVYLELVGGRQPGLGLAASPLPARTRAAPVVAAAGPRTPRLMSVSDAELAAHEKFLDRIKEPIWKQG